MPIYLYEVPRIQHWNVLQIRSLIPSWPEPVSLVYLSVYLSFRRIRRAVRIITNPMKRNLGAALRALTTAEKYLPPVEKCRTKSLYLLLFLLRRFRLENCDPSSPHVYDERFFFPSFSFLILLIVYWVYVVLYWTCHTLPRTLSRSFKQVYKSRKLHAWLLPFSLFLSLSSYRIQFAREIVPLIWQHGNKCSESKEIQVWRERYFSNSK